MHTVFQHDLAVPDLLESHTPRVARQRRARKISYRETGARTRKGKRALARESQQQGLRKAISRNNTADVHLVSRTARAIRPLVFLHPPSDSLDALVAAVAVRVGKAQNAPASFPAARSNNVAAGCPARRAHSLLEQSCEEPASQNGFRAARAALDPRAQRIP